MRIFETFDELKAAVGQEVAVSDWVEVTQAQVDLFAEATGDHQWIHVDVERAKAGPFGAPIAHGFLTLSLLPRLMESSLEVRESKMSVNYGLNKVRFTSPVPVGSRLRARISVVACESIAGNGVQIEWRVAMEREGSEKPACVAETVSRAYA
ncbi:MaoC family dehydratase [Ramlibacter sp.]|uniref:MaoC family dehydratase n=1 Tax=Ramlibacter sp. TaxID=1917967 RepID=UPI003D145381